MKADRVNFEQPSESLEATRKAANGFLDFLRKNLEEKGQIFANVPRKWFLWIANINSLSMRLKLAVSFKTPLLAVYVNWPFQVDYSILGSLMNCTVQYL